MWHDSRGSCPLTEHLALGKLCALWLLTDQQRGCMFRALSPLTVPLQVATAQFEWNRFLPLVRMSRAEQRGCGAGHRTRIAI